MYSIPPMAAMTMNENIADTIAPPKSDHGYMAPLSFSK